MVAEVEVVHAVADVYDVLFHHFLAYYQLSEVYHVLKLLNDVLKSHHLQVFVELHVLDDKCKTDWFACTQH